ncbi:MAG: DKNYY domain-containing protein [Minisyncoccota bacterium]
MKDAMRIGIPVAVLALLILGAWVAYKPTSSEQKIEWRSVSALPHSYSPSSRANTWYWYDNGVISCMHAPLSGEDVATFQASSLGEYAKDKNHVYDCDNIVKDADPATFTILNQVYAKDARHVFYIGGTIIPGADPATFVPVTTPLAKNSLQSEYGKDTNHVYWNGRVIAGADSATFVLSPVTRDKNWIYQNDTVVGPVSLATDNTQYSTALPAACNPSNAETIYPRPYPSVFSADGNVIGYTSDNAVCVIDKSADTVRRFPYGTQQGVSISKDGSKVLYFKYQKGDGVGGQTCADCGQYSIDRATGVTQKL